jgi:putative ABC transport system substrate-binding protein
LKRRNFILAAATALAFPRAAPAQDLQRQRRVIIMLSIAIDEPSVITRVAALKVLLGEMGWIEGRNIQYEVRSSNGDPAMRQKLADEIIASAPDLVATSATPDTTVMLKGTHTIPIFFSTATDPVGAGFVQSLTRPGGNATGFTNSHPSMGSKWLEILKELAPDVRRVGVMFNPVSAPRNGDYYLEPLKALAPSFGIELAAVPITDPAAIPAGVASLAGEPAGGLVVMPDSFVVAHRKIIVSSAAQYRVPAIYPYFFFMNEGGLISYGFSYESSVPEKSEVVVTTAEYINLILRGANPAELPVRSPRLYELLINLKTAKALGLTVPRALLARADKVYE